MSHPIARKTALLLIVATGLLSGCQEAPPVSGVLNPTEDRSQKLMALAAKEAGRIPDDDKRLTRQLNLADLQISRGWIDDGRQTLAEARTTLVPRSGSNLSPHARISGWVSISELSPRTPHMAGAASATTEAINLLDKIEDPAKRCEYVMGIANEAQYTLPGHKAEAATLLARAGPWTISIDSIPQRRLALVAFSTALFNLDDFNAGTVMIDREPDAAWRSDVLASMAQVVPEEQGVSSDSKIASPITGALLESRQSATSQPFYGKELNYDQVFKNQKASNTSKD